MVILTPKYCKIFLEARDVLHLEGFKIHPSLLIIKLLKSSRFLQFSVQFTLVT